MLHIALHYLYSTCLLLLHIIYARIFGHYSNSLVRFHGLIEHYISHRSLVIRVFLFPLVIPSLHSLRHIVRSGPLRGPDLTHCSQQSLAPLPHSLR